MRIILLLSITFISINLSAQSCVDYNNQDQYKPIMKKNTNKEDWKNKLTEEQYRVTQEKGTERPFLNKYYNTKDKGVYKCICCGTDLFLSETKYDSGSGWPSFYAPVSNDKVKIVVDKSHGMIREEIECANCGAHLGHVFDDGPQPTGKRYCTNSASLNLFKE